MIYYHEQTISEREQEHKDLADKSMHMLRKYDPHGRSGKKTQLKQNCSFVH